MKKYLFSSFADWRKSMYIHFLQLWDSLAGLFLDIVFGIASLFLWMYKKVCAFCRREPVAAALIAIVFLCMAFGWLYTFVTEREAAVSAQHVADSLSYDLSRIMQAYDTVIVDGDTLKYNL